MRLVYQPSIETLSLLVPWLVNTFKAVVRGYCRFS